MNLLKRRRIMLFPVEFWEEQTNNEWPDLEVRFEDMCTHFIFITFTRVVIRCRVFFLSEETTKVLMCFYRAINILITRSFVLVWLKNVGLKQAEYTEDTLSAERNIGTYSKFHTFWQTNRIGIAIRNYLFMKKLFKVTYLICNKILKV